MTVLADSSASAQERPLVFIPGILGSVLETKSGNVVWGDVRSLSRLGQLTIPDGPSDPSDGLVATTTIQQVAILGPFKIKQYSTLRQTLANLGYQLGINYVEFPYDWRQSNYTTAKQFAEFVRTNDTLKGREFDILAHSMGGLVAEIYVKEHDRNERRVRRVINMAVPFNGSVNTFATLTEGWGEPANWITGGLPTIRKFALSIPSFYELLPRYSNCCILGRPDDPQRTPYNPIIPQAWKYIDWIPGDAPTAEGTQRLANVLKATARLRDLASEPYPVHVKVSYLVGSSVDTRWQFYADRSTSSIALYSNGRGDGTVPEASAAAGDLSRAFVSMGQHGTIYDDTAAAEFLRRVLFPTAEGPERYNARTYSASTVSGDVVGVTSIGLAVTPSVAVPGDTVAIELRVTADAGAPADQLAVVASVRDPNGVQIPLTLERQLDSSSPLVSQGIYRTTVSAGSQPGPMTVTVTTAGLPVLQDFFAIVERQ
ncbi:hypothetical protein GBZ48_30145 [Azospirillum melinis]|uniref:Lecithin:cholesterol acyltransferase n=1 Tax=Azospirillum melinis TaxID=328839 RepID=A0ABX2KLA4_9PROT|nr:hypothetical protein [Azospirillum melinis]MBP2305979.1 pimeloyl-ACP methyl ester carboxylesterase [Azospirillum melinis]NUB03486.1 hypothetical protein [Azospirillum melinis]